MPALIFDCDGVLADTERDGHLPAFNAAFAEFGVPVTWTPAEYAEKLRIGGGKERLMTVFDDHLDLPWPETDADRADLVRRLHARKTELFTELVAAGHLPGRPGIARIIADALEAGWQVAVASTSAESSVRAVLRHAAGDDAAAQCHIFAGDIVRHKKPAPDIYLKALGDLALDAADCLVVEDSGVGLTAARAAGLTTVVTVSTFTATDDFTDAALVLPDLGGVTFTDLAAVLPHHREEKQ